MPWSKWRGHRFIRPIRVLSFALGILGLLIAVVLYVFLDTTDPTPPIFKYALITLTFETWCGLFLISGVATVWANITHKGVRIAHAYGCFVWSWWAIILTVATIDPGLATSGYSYLCGIAALAHWVCASYWYAENPNAVG
jgi:hypothetical protein